MEYWVQIGTVTLLICIVIGLCYQIIEKQKK